VMECEGYGGDWVRRGRRKGREVREGEGGEGESHLFSFFFFEKTAP
jgi:hypothetical protein